MDIAYSTDSYPVRVTVDLGDFTADTVSPDPSSRLRDLLMALSYAQQTGATAEIVLNEDFASDLTRLIHENSYYQMAIRSILGDQVSPCEHDSKYARGSTDEGSRYFTPKEYAEKAVKAITEMNDNFKGNS